MHVMIATKIYNDIKKRGIDQLQDLEDDLMINGKLSNANKLEFLNFLKRETDK